MNTENENQNISFEEEEENNADIRANRLLTVVNHAYDGPGAYDKNRLTAKCIKVLLLPRI